MPDWPLVQTVRPEEDPFAGIPSAAQGLSGDLLPAARKAKGKPMAETETRRRFAGGRCNTMGELAKLLNDCAEKYGAVELVQVLALPGESPIGWLIARQEEAK